MNRDEIITILGVLKTAYPRFYANLSEEDTLSTIELWQEMFKNDSPQDITTAVKELICTLEYPPTIADIKRKIKKYDDDRKFIEYAKHQEELERQERLMLEEKYRR